MSTLDPERLLAETTWLRRLAAQLAGDPHAADDLVQDTWLAALEHPPRVESEGRLRGWFVRVMHNNLRMRRRGDARRAARERNAARPEAIAASDAADDRIAAQQRLLDAVAALPAADREVVVLRHLDQLPPRAIAERLGTTSEAVRSRLARALATLRQRLTPVSGDRRGLLLALAPLLDRGGAPAGIFGSSLLLVHTTTKLLAATVAVGATVGLALFLTHANDNAPATADASKAVPIAAATADTGGTDAQASARDAVAAGPAARELVAPAAPMPHTAQPGQHVLHVVARCVTPSGAPIAGARLIAAEVEGHPEVRAGADGRATLELAWPARLTSGNPHWIEVRVTGDGLSAVRRQEAVEGEGDLTITLGDIVLVPGGDVVGRVVDANGEPAPDAFVFAVGATEPTNGAAEEQRRVCGREFAQLGSGIAPWVTTGADGRYRIEGLPAGRVSVVARRHDRLFSYTSPFEVIAGPATQAPTIALERVPDQNRIAGTLRDETGQLVTSVEVSAYANRGPRNVDPIATAEADDAGRFDLAVLSGRRYTLVFQAMVGNQRRERILDDVAAGTTDLAAQMAPRTGLAVVAHGPAGEPIAIAQVGGEDETHHGLRIEFEARSDGSAEVFAPDQTFRLWIYAAGWQPRQVGPFAPGQLPPRIEVELQRPDMARGRVLAGGHAVAGAKVHLHFVDPQQSFYRFAAHVFTRLMAASPGDVATDADGRFELPIPRAGRYVLHAEAEGFARGESTAVDFAPDAAAAPIEIELPRAGSIAGIVVVAPGQSREGTIVAATRGDGHVDVCISDAEGGFRFADLAPGDWQVRACRFDDQQWLRMARTWPKRDLGALPVDVALAPGANATFDVDLRSRAAAEIQGHAAIDGVDIRGWRVSVRIEDEFEATTVDATGAFTLRSPSGATWVYLSGELAPGRFQIARPVQLVDGANAFTIDARTGGLEITGLLPSAPSPERGRRAGYALVWTEGGFVYSFDPDADGCLRAAALPAGRAQLRRREAPDRRAEEGTPIADVEIEAGGFRRHALR